MNATMQRTETRTANRMGRKKRYETSQAEESTVYGVRMTKVYAAWLESLSKHERCGKADVIDRALAAYAKAIGFEPPPER